MRYKPTTHFDRITFYNRWKERYPTDSYTIIGISKWWCSPESYCYKLCFFGFECKIWLTRKFKQDE